MSFVRWTTNSTYIQYDRRTPDDREEGDIVHGLLCDEPGHPGSAGLQEAGHCASSQGRRNSGRNIGGITYNNYEYKSGVWLPVFLSV